VNVRDERVTACGLHRRGHILYLIAFDRYDHFIIRQADIAMNEAVYLDESRLMASGPCHTTVTLLVIVLMNRMIFCRI
tara:strand:- start:316 stop:549 length:234 start_codon:yes stop_codon:yes gene_type:complete